MAASPKPDTSLRLDRLDLSRLLWAFLISLAIHAVCVGGYKLGQSNHWWDAIRWPQWLKLARPAQPLANDPAVDATQREIPLMFVEVNPVAAVTEPPPEAKYYSDKSSKAANPDAEVESNVPKIDGTQTQIVKTEEVPRSKAVPLQPAPTPATPAPEEQEEARLKPAPPPGDLVMAKPAETFQPDPGEAKQSRPRTIKEALARQPQPSGLTGERMKQDGGVKRRAIMSSLDVKATPFGAYDSAIIAAVQNRWFYLLDSGDFTRNRTGKVVVEFRLHSDGRISNMTVVENSVNELLSVLCQRAISDPSPYDKWPSDMRRMVGGDYREVRFTFFYN